MANTNPSQLLPSEVHLLKNSTSIFVLSCKNINSTLNIDILLGPMNGSDMACDTESQGKWTK
ncbi:hypothetical protein NC652_023291 [Populus alba x Populus x berolinensis]|nr:hypothetical protein NC652_023291 [Populus alba x Populus x berolinensis]